MVFPTGVKGLKGHCIMNMTSKSQKRIYIVTHDSLDLSKDYYASARKLLKGCYHELRMQKALISSEKVG